MELFWEDPKFILIWNLIIQIFIFIFIGIVLYKILPARSFDEQNTSETSQPTLFNNIGKTSDSWYNKMQSKLQTKYKSVKNNLLQDENKRKENNKLSIFEKVKLNNSNNSNNSNNTQQNTNNNSNWFNNLTSFDPTKTNTSTTSTTGTTNNTQSKFSSFLSFDPTKS